MCTRRSMATYLDFWPRKLGAATRPLKSYVSPMTSGSIRGCTPAAGGKHMKDVLQFRATIRTGGAVSILTSRAPLVTVSVE